MKSLDSMNIGFIGLGLMGKPMARNLKRAGAQVSVYNRSRQKVDEMAKEGFTPLASPAEAAKSSVVICMVSDTAAVEEILFGENGIIKAAPADSLVIDMGTTEVGATRKFAIRLIEARCHFVDAPASGGEVGAIEGTLSIMVGASESDMQRVKPILDVLGKQVVHVGDVGSGQIAKAANQIIVGLTIGAVAEAFALARDGGADLDKVWQALRGGFADSRILQLHGRRMIEQNFVPGGTAHTQHKDLSQALAFADSNATNLPSTELCRDLYEKLIRQGDGQMDHSALFRIYSQFQ